RQFHRRRYPLTLLDMSLNLRPQLFAEVSILKKHFQQRQIFPQQPKQQVFRPNRSAAELARLEPGEENYAPRLFREAFEHGRNAKGYACPVTPATAIGRVNHLHPPLSTLFTRESSRQPRKAGTIALMATTDNAPKYQPPSAF